jgi:two-component system phosphate regulon sensor histidine kinase PhoR
MAGDSTRALIASPQFVEEQWMVPARVVASDQSVAFRLGDTGSNTPPLSAKLKAAETGLPWDVVATSLQSSGSDPGFLFRRRLLMAGFVLLTLMAVTTSYLIYRAIGRELAAVQLQSDFVSTVSHEFRTPLTAMRQFTTMLRESPHLSEDRRIVCYDAQMRATDRLLNLVESLLDFGRMEAGARRYQFEQRDCAEVVRRAVEEFRKDPQAEHHAIEFRADVPVQAETDAEALSRAVRNLLENAVKYSPDDKHVDVALNRSNGHVRISVRDRGIGIPADDKVRIFKKFQRGEQARLRGIKGTGIGLTMVDEIARAHRGRVELESEPGAGSTFTIVLPASD